MDAEYPRTLKEVRDGGIDKVLNLLGHVDVSEIKDKKKTLKPWISDIFLQYILERIEEDIENYSRDTSNKMKKIISKGGCNRRFEAEAWTSEVEWETCVSGE